MIAIVDYGVGNLRSAAKALERAAAEIGEAIEVRVTDSADVLDGANAVVLPGVGAFGACMASLERSGLVPTVLRAAASGRPFLGICVGMQILFSESEEFGPIPGLGVLPGKVVRFRTPGIKVPQIGWNALRIRSEASAFAGIPDSTWFYFVHSFYAVPDDPCHVAATADYEGEEFCAAVQRGNLFATQFHPEKSQEAGIALLRNFVRAALPPRVGKVATPSL